MLKLNPGSVVLQSLALFCLTNSQCHESSSILNHRNQTEINCTEKGNISGDMPACN